MRQLGVCAGSSANPTLTHGAEMQTDHPVAAPAATRTAAHSADPPAILSSPGYSMPPPRHPSTGTQRPLESTDRSPLLQTTTLLALSPTPPPRPSPRPPHPYPTPPPPAP